MPIKSKRRRPRLLKRQEEASYYFNLFCLSESKVGDGADGNQISEA